MKKFVQSLMLAAVLGISFVGVGYCVEDVSHKFAEQAILNRVFDSTNNLLRVEYVFSGESTFNGTIVGEAGINVTTATVLGDLEVGGNIASTGTITAGTGVVTLTNANGNILPAILAAGSLPSTVIVSSIAVNAVIPSSIASGSLPSTVIVSSIAAGTLITAESIMTGSLGSSVLCSSIAANIPIAAANIQAGNLANTVICSSVAVNGITSAQLKSDIYTIKSLILDTAYEVGIDTPSAVGQLMRNSVWELYISSGIANCDNWIKVGGQ